MTPATALLARGRARARALAWAAAWAPAAMVAVTASSRCGGLTPRLRVLPCSFRVPLAEAASSCFRPFLQSHMLRAAQALSSLSGGDTLSPGKTLASPDGQSKLVFQDDGNIVVRTERQHS